MLTTLRGLPLRIPSESAVRGVFSRGGNYRVNAREGKAFEIHLARVLFIRADGHAVERVPEEMVTELLTLTALAQPGEQFQHPSNVGRPEQDIATDPAVLDVAISPRGARVLARVLSVRARMRAEAAAS